MTRVETGRCIKSVFFSPLSCWQHAATAMSAFIHALYETNMVGVVRYVWRNNTQPKLMVLVPHIKADYEVRRGGGGGGGRGKLGYTPPPIVQLSDSNY